MDSKRSTTAIKVLIISTDCNPKTELPFSDDNPVEWNDIVDSLDHAKYCLAIHRLTPPSDLSTSNAETRNSRQRVAFLSLQASKKAAFLYTDYAVSPDHYQITYDENLMDDLPTFCHIKGLPRFHLFTSLPDDLQLSVVKLLDGVGFARMRCVNRQFSRLKWDRFFDIHRYSLPNAKVEEPKKSNYFLDKESKKYNYFFENSFFLWVVSAVCIVGVAYGIFNDVGSGECSDEEYEYISQ